MNAGVIIGCVAGLLLAIVLFAALIVWLISRCVTLTEAHVDLDERVTDIEAMFSLGPPSGWKTNDD